MGRSCEKQHQRHERPPEGDQRSLFAKGWTLLRRHPRQHAFRSRFPGTLFGCPQLCFTGKLFLAKEKARKRQKMGQELLAEWCRLAYNKKYG
ncbi:hypothetical protein, partial [Nocardiopsis halotolerans]|uniref:hypothetical protein n=1 Tax=Nocardiopsis halotolerans TaxID=124252 RepID=UPI0019D3CCFE